MIMKINSTLLNFPEQEPHHQMQFSVIFIYIYEILVLVFDFRLID